MTPAPSAFDQAAASVRLEWGPVGAAVLAPAASVCVVVDVLSFTTSVGVAVEGGAAVHPFRWRDDRTAAYAASLGAELAVGRRAAGPGHVSLSPVSMRAGSLPARLVLPSPNGSAICAAVREQAGEEAGEQPSGSQVLAGSLRNIRAVAAALVEVLDGGGSVALVPAGERWLDGGLRPAVEDLWGAGALAAHIEDAAVATLSPEATVAAAAWRAVAHDVPTALHGCVSGRELDQGGFGPDVDVAAEVDTSPVVPVLVDGAFVAR